MASPFNWLECPALRPTPRPCMLHWRIGSVAVASMQVTILVHCCHCGREADLGEVTESSVPRHPEGACGSHLPGVRRV